MADFDHAAVAAVPGEGLSRAAAAHRLQVVVRREQRVARQQVLDVGNQQLLVLLFVVQAQRDQGQQPGVVCVAGQQALHALVHIGAVGQHLGQRGAREQAALRARVLGAHAVVVRIEQHAKRRVERCKRQFVRLQHKGLEEPGGVRQVPFGGAGVGHGLGAGVFRRQRGRQRHRALAHGGIVGRLRGRVGRRRQRVHHPASVPQRGGIRRGESRAVQWWRRKPRVIKAAHAPPQTSRAGRSRPGRVRSRRAPAGR